MTSKTSKTITTYPAICWLLGSDNGHSTIWHLVGLDGLIAVMKSPGTYWVWVNCSCHNIGLVESIAFIWSLALDQNGSNVVCIFSGICGTGWAYGLPWITRLPSLHLLVIFDLGDSTVWRSIFGDWLTSWISITWFSVTCWSEWLVCSQFIHWLLFYLHGWTAITVFSCNCYIWVALLWSRHSMAIAGRYSFMGVHVFSAASFVCLAR